MINATMVGSEWFFCKDWIDAVMIIVSYFQVFLPFGNAMFLLGFVNYLVENQLKNEDETAKSTYIDDFS